MERWRPGAPWQVGGVEGNALFDVDVGNGQHHRLRPIGRHRNRVVKRRGLRRKNLEWKRRGESPRWAKRQKQAPDVIHRKYPFVKGRDVRPGTNETNRNVCLTGLVCARVRVRVCVRACEGGSGRFGWLKGVSTSVRMPLPPPTSPDKARYPYHSQQRSLTLHASMRGYNAFRFLTKLGSAAHIRDPMEPPKREKTV